MGMRNSETHLMGWIPVSALALALSACGGVPPEDQRPAGPIGTQVEGESFSSLEVSADRLSGVFVRRGQSLAFDVDHRNGASSLRLSTATGEPLFWLERVQDGTKLRLGTSYASFLPASASKPPVPGASPRNQSPAGFEATGDVRQAMNALKTTSIVILPYLASALGRLGQDGANSRIALPLHMAALTLTKELKLEIDSAVVDQTNRLIAARNGSVSHAIPGASEHVFKPEAFSQPITCPVHPPCPPGMIVAKTGLLTGCCISATPPPPPPTPIEDTDQSSTPNCSSGYMRENFNYLYNDPCRDDCLGMCGPGCSTWYWVCGDAAVHAACWNHDSAYCKEFLDVWGFPVPNPDYPVCESEYLAYSEWIFDDVFFVHACNNDSVTDSATTPWAGLDTSVPTFFVTYK